jgi:hypothetical protein
VGVYSFRFASDPWVHGFPQSTMNCLSTIEQKEEGWIGLDASSRGERADRGMGGVSNKCGVIVGLHASAAGSCMLVIC